MSHSSKIFLPGESVCSLSRIIIDDALLRTSHVTKAYFSIISARPSPKSAHLQTEKALIEIPLVVGQHSQPVTMISQHWNVLYMQHLRYTSTMPGATRFTGILMEY